MARGVVWLRAEVPSAVVHWASSAAAAKQPVEKVGPMERKGGPGMKPFDTLMKNASEEKQYAGPGVRPGRLMVRRPSQRALLPCPTADGH